MARAKSRDDTWSAWIPTDFVCCMYPEATAVTLIVPGGMARMEYLPSGLVRTPTAVPSIITVALSIGFPLSSVTVPVSIPVPSWDSS